MGEITIKVPQKINRCFRVNNRRYAEEILKDLERRSVPPRTISAKNGRLKELKELMDDYRNNPDAETKAVIEIAKSWREKWNR